MFGGERSVQQANGHHILQAMIAVRRVVQWSGFADDADG
jgi:hypothetical protein